MPYLSTIQEKQDITRMAQHHTMPQHDSRWLVVSIAAITPPQKG